MTYVRIYEDDAVESASIIAWTERRLEHAQSAGSVAWCQRQFKRMWLASFGTLDNVPETFRARVTALYNEMKAKEDAESER